ncbi:MAG: response regulator [Sphaerospermopsis sp. SIO1G1]|nr:response regulator [Sphaerospermopsis sp. SIO1G1]
MTNSLGSNRLFNKLHPLSLLAQLKAKKITGCLSVNTGIYFWSIYLEEGKLVYATYSDQVFERLESHLHKLNPEIPTFNDQTYEQMELILGGTNNGQLIPNADYHAICWLVQHGYITSTQAGTLIEEIVVEVFESFLSLKAGNYNLNANHGLNSLDHFCSLDLQLIIAKCQKNLIDKQKVQSKKISPNTIINQFKPSKLVEEKKTQLDNTEENTHYDISGLQKTSYTIACIDDSQAVLNSLQYFLDESIFSVLTINDPVKALLQIIRSKPDVILLDVEMPNLDGYELCSLLRKHSGFQNTPIIMVTSRKGFVDKAKAKIVRSSGYLTKPFTRTELLKMISKHID